MQLCWLCFKQFRSFGKLETHSREHRGRTEWDRLFHNEWRTDHKKKK